MQAFEKLGSFYLGKVFDLESQRRSDQYLLYDSKDLTTHAVCVGMTGSGKTGLCIGLLEEAALDGVPALIIDPKGDMSNLLLSFPELRAEDFLPWVQASEAERKGQTLEEFAASTAQKWSDGLAEWEQDGNRIAAMRDKVEFTVYTPGSSAGRPLSILRLVDLPSRAVLEDPEALNDYAGSTVSSLLALLGIQADPMNSRDHILLANILLDAWQNGRALDLAALIQAIQQPNITQVGVLPLDIFYPANDRFQLAMRFNNLLASPQFAAWMQGEPLDVSRLLYTPTGKPRVSILSINHLNDSERMFFVSTFLNQVVSWMRSQSGTGSLRAILYMDEIFGFFPPVANPPSKKPLLTLLKQARAFGLGVVLTTQNPVDLDYKGLANIGTWFVGRLQTEQDKARLLDGLQGASTAAAQQFDRRELDELLSKLQSRIFLVNNVHEDRPELFETRWAMSYLAGPLTRNQIAKLQPEASVAVPDPVAEAVAEPAAAPVAAAATAAAPVAAAATAAAVPQSMNMLPQIPQDIAQYFLAPDRRANRLVYMPSLYAYVDTAFNDTKKHISTVESSIWNTPVKQGVLTVQWEEATGAKPEPDSLETKATPGASFGELSDAALKKTNYTQWKGELVDYVYREQVLTLYRNDASDMVSKHGESQRDFIIRVQQEGREVRDQKMDALKDKYSKKIATLQEKVRKAEQAVEREEDQAGQAKLNTFISIGSTILDSLLGRKVVGKSTAGKAASTVRNAGRAKQQASDVARAKDSLQTYQSDLEAIEAEMQDELDKLSASHDAASEEIQVVQMRPKKSDINVKVLALLWLPYEQDTEGGLAPAFRTEE